MAESAYLYSEKSLIEGVGNNDEQAMRIVYNRHYGTIRTFVTNNGGTVQEAKDVYQDAFIIFYEKIRDGSLTLTCKPGTYLYAVCRRLWLKRLSEKARFDTLLPEAENLKSVIEIDYNEEKEERIYSMKAALCTLGEPCRTILEDFYYGGITMQAIAEKFGYTNTDNAKNQKYKCLQRLKKLYFGKKR